MAGKGSGRREGDDGLAYSNNFDNITWSSKDNKQGETQMNATPDEMITLHDKEHNKEASADAKPITVRDKSQALPQDNLMDKVAYGKD